MGDATAAAGANSPHLNASEQRQAATHTSPRALILHEIVREDGEAALTRTPGALALSGLAGGLSMGFSFLAQSLVRADLPDEPWAHLIDSFGYSIGFIIVILAQQQLFTESTVTAMLPVLTRRSLAVFGATARLWIIVLFANLIGTWIFAGLLLPDGIFRDDVVRTLHRQAIESIPNGFGATFLKAIFAGWLIALMVWLLPSARSARLLTVLIVTYLVSLARLSHIVAGSVEAAYAVMSGSIALADYFVKFMAPTLLGNIVGGVALVALLNHGTVAPEILAESGTAEGDGRPPSGASASRAGKVRRQGKPSAEPSESGGVKSKPARSFM
jgi:formate/nitrite transporter FocA (FNT family)